MSIVRAVRFVRRMRGGAQAHLVRADDDNFYVVKLVQNPQGHRILFNDWVGTRLLQNLGIACASPEVVELTPEFIQSYPEMGIFVNGRHCLPEPGHHFGSMYPGDPERTAVFDFVPDTLLAKVANLDHFVRVLPLDQWAGNADARQCVLLRTRVRSIAPAIDMHPLKTDFVAVMVDQGYFFNGPHWEFVSGCGCGLYFRPCVYADINADLLDQSIEKVERLPLSVVAKAVAEVPEPWFDGDYDAVARLMNRLACRQRRVGELVHHALAYASDMNTRQLVGAAR